MTDRPEKPEPKITGFRIPEELDDRLTNYIHHNRKQKLSKASVMREAVEVYLEDPFIRLPIIGRVAAGTPILAEENVEGYRRLPTSLAGGADYLLTVKGDSMAPTICDGDLVGVRRQPAADHDGQIVVARIEDEATVKRFRKQAGRLELTADNPEYPAIDPRHAVMEGVVVVQIRRWL